jgi:type IV secretion system protein VirB9
MQDELLVVDRVSRRLMLRAGHAVVGVWNEAFDLDGVPPAEGTTVPGVRRVLKVDPTLVGRVGRVGRVGDTAQEVPHD